MRDRLLKLSKRIQTRQGKEYINEEQTKTEFILPFFSILGYDIHNELGVNEFRCEVPVQTGSVQNNKIDYLIDVDNHKIVVEAKKIGQGLTKDNVIQLKSYYVATGSRIGILTNGDEYWFFGDEVKTNIMDEEPYLKIKLSEIDDDDIEDLKRYSKDKIINLDVTTEIKLEKYKDRVAEFIQMIEDRKFTDGFMKYMKSGLNIKGIEEKKLEEILDRGLTRAFGIGDKAEILSENTLEHVTIDKNKEEKTSTTEKTDVVTALSNGYIVYNTIDMTGHKIDKMMFRSKVYDTHSIMDVVINVVKVLCNEFGAESEIEKDFGGIKQRIYRISRNPDVLQNAARYKIEGTDLWISKCMNANGAIRWAGMILKDFGIPDNELLIKLR